MYTTTKVQIIEFIRKNGHAQVKELVQLLGITPAAVHRSLNKLVAENLILKKGSPPKVFYYLRKETGSTANPLISDNQRQTLDQFYSYITPTGKIEIGVDGFLLWMKNTKNLQNPEKCIQDYIKILNESENHKNKTFQMIDATARFNEIFGLTYLDRVYYHDFYSLIKFGKTKMGQFLLNGKQSQNKKMIKLISDQIQSGIQKLVIAEKIDAIAWAPHSIPRKIPFLKELERNLNFTLPKIEIVKVYTGEIPIAQKSLSKIEERIQNARETMVVVPREIKAKKVLLIDDAVGSGATLNEIAGKLKSKGAQKVIGFAIVGSYKGFEVIKEV